MNASLRSVLLIAGALSLGVVVWNTAHASTSPTGADKGGKDGGSVELAGKEGGSIELAGKEGGSIELTGKEGGSIELAGKEGGSIEVVAKGDAGK
jgi:hypothetical protein